MKLEQSFLFFTHLVVMANIVKPILSRRNIDCNQKAKTWHDQAHQKAKCNKTWEMVFETQKQISTRNSRHIQIKGRKIDSKGEDGAEHAKLTIKSNYYAYVMIVGTRTGYYLCLSKTGRLVGRPKVGNKKMKRCIYKRKYSSKGFILYESTWHRGWYLAFRSDGTPKPANRVNPNSRSAQFMEVALRSSPDHPQKRFGRRLLKRRQKAQRLRKQRSQKQMHS